MADLIVGVLLLVGFASAAEIVRATCLRRLSAPMPSARSSRFARRPRFVTLQATAEPTAMTQAQQPNDHYSTGDRYSIGDH